MAATVVRRELDLSIKWMERYPGPAVSTVVAFIKDAASRRQIITGERYGRDIIRLTEGENP